MTEETYPIGAHQSAPAVQTNTSCYENIDQSDLIIPRGKLLQALSPELIANDKLKSGMIINSLTQEVLPDRFVPISVGKEWLCFNPRSANDKGFDDKYAPGALKWRSKNPNDERVIKEGSFGPNGEPPVALAVLNFLSYFPKSGETPVVVSFSKTSYSEGRRLLSLIKFSGKHPYENSYKISSVQATNDYGTYNVLKVSPAGKSAAKEKEFCQDLWSNLSGQDVVAHVEDTEEIPF